MTSSGGGEAAPLCRDRMYVTRHVAGLPRTCRHVGDVTGVEYARVDELDECRRMIEQSATRGDNVGLDQYCIDVKTF